MRFYPDIPHRFANRLVSDVLVVAAVVLLALLGLQVRHTVNRLVVVPQGVQETGSAVQSGFHDAAGVIGKQTTAAAISSRCSAPRARGPRRRSLRWA